ncbi:hypothetical protein, conserved [Angomonas deanei]|uniref:Uncharacterized protein n=1 Tax=Angomonas deanei TaxID=59799 RepID=A0A7G2C4H5_9TRYP|nr:hypothetical protein, conserved [Angomonas deanei]
MTDTTPSGSGVYGEDTTSNGSRRFVISPKVREIITSFNNNSGSGLELNNSDSTSFEMWKCNRLGDRGKVTSETSKTSSPPPPPEGAKSGDRAPSAGPALKRANAFVRSGTHASHRNSFEGVVLFQTEEYSSPKAR